MLSQTLWCHYQCRYRFHCFITVHIQTPQFLPNTKRYRLHGFMPNADSDSIVSLPMQIQTLQCHAQCRFRLHGVITNGDSDTMMSCSMQIRLHSVLPNRQSPLFHAQCRFRLYCVITNADSDSTVS